MKNRILTNSARTIKKTFPRFLSLIIMSLLGVMVFVGLLATSPDMLATLDNYYDEKNVYCAWRNTLQGDNRTVNINLDFFVKNGGNYFRCGESFKEKAYTDDELTNAVEDANFKVLSRFHESTFDVPTDKTERVTYIVGRSDYFG